MGRLVRAVIDGKVLASSLFIRGRTYVSFLFQASMRALVPSPIFLRIDKRGEMSGVILRGVVAFAAILCNSLSDLPLSLF